MGRPPAQRTLQPLVFGPLDTLTRWDGLPIRRLGQPTGISITEFEEGLRAYDPCPIFFGARVAGSSGRHRKTVLSGCLG